jgi:hypothetical protein
MVNILTHTLTNTWREKEICGLMSVLSCGCDDGNMSVFTCSTHQDVYIKCVQFFVYQLLLNKAIFQKSREIKNKDQMHNKMS